MVGAFLMQRKEDLNMQKHEFLYEEKHHVLTVDGKDYAVPQRTAEREKLLREHDEKLGELTEYESNMDLLTILFGAAAAHAMFPEGDKTNLDKLAKCTKYALALYMSEYAKTQAENIAEKFSQVEPMIKQINDASKAVNNLHAKNDFKKHVAKKRR